VFFLIIYKNFPACSKKDNPFGVADRNILILKDFAGILIDVFSPQGVDKKVLGCT